MTELSVSGNLQIEVALSREATEAQCSDVKVLLEIFLHAIDLGMFSPARLDSSTLVMSLEGALRAELVVQSFPTTSLAVLRGMLQQYAASAVPLASASVTLNADTKHNFFDVAPGTELVRLSPNLQLPAQIDLPAANDPLVVLVEFAEDVPPTLHDHCYSIFETWNILLCGGFPPVGATPASSVVRGPISTRFLMPAMLQHALEGWFAHPSSIHPLLNALAVLSETRRIVSVVVE